MRSRLHCTTCAGESTKVASVCRKMMRRSNVGNDCNRWIPTPFPTYSQGKHAHSWNWRLPKASTANDTLLMRDLLFLLLHVAANKSKPWKPL